MNFRYLMLQSSTYVTYKRWHRQFNVEMQHCKTCVGVKVFLLKLSNGPVDLPVITGCKNFAIEFRNATATHATALLGLYPKTNKKELQVKPSCLVALFADLSSV